MNTTLITPPSTDAAPSPPSLLSLLPPDDALRTALHNEVHARPSPRVRLPALMFYVAVLNEGINRAAECAHLQRLPGQAQLALETLNGNFLRLRFEGYNIKWERHTEFTRYTLVQALPERAFLGAAEPEVLSELKVGADWLRNIPGRTVAAIKLVMLHGDVTDPVATLALAQKWFGGRDLVASQLGGGHSLALTDFRLAASGFERMLVVAPPEMSPSRAGRISQRLLEIETYRLMALRGLPVAKALGSMLSAAEEELADITAHLEGKSTSDQDLLDTLVSLATRVERATAQHSYRFSATQAYATLVTERIEELREKAIPGTQTIGEFMQRRLSPAIATVAATAQRLGSLSERVSRTSALLRTRVDIATELQNQQLLAKLTRGQELQLRLQSTVEGLSIAAITYYVITLAYYGVKALKQIGLPLNPEIATGALIPLVLWVVWRATRSIHERLQKGG